MLYPLRFFPIYQTAIWGGGDVFRNWGRELVTCENIAESWEISGHRNGISVVANGFLKGVTLQELVADYKNELLGIHAEELSFPLFVKFLDARQKLSVQVHPDQAVIQKLRLQDKEKAEAWVILDVKPGSRISLGFKWPVTRKIVSDLAITGRLEEILHTFEPKIGECYFIPPGMVHSMGAGIVAYEIQRCSDLTLRLYDWNRHDKNGQKRQLHIKNAVLASNLLHWQVGPIPPHFSQKHPHTEYLIHSEYFFLDRWNVLSGQKKEFFCDGRCHVLTFLDGKTFIEGMETPLLKGETILLPASLDSVNIYAEENTVFLDAYLP